ncbi:amidohydrolase family protein [Spirosoma panaciterrae]|uniref:amidohydrolase family protein n=1 Tax=Spirosoma panaciterrae TaxID=496058 RepID=UPI000381C4AD|nr:amidohydrolase family protein [Spirosoma panaciterrae]
MISPLPPAIIDAHLHIWDVQQLNYPWLTDVPAISRTFTITDYQQVIERFPVQAMVFVQCECEPGQYQREIDYVTQAAAIDSRIRGIVAWFPLEHPNIDLELTNLLGHPLLRGIRRLEESPRSLYEQPQFIRNVAKLATIGLSFDICLKAHQLPVAIRLVEKCPDTPFMLDHLGKPNIAGKELVNWQAHIRQLASHPLAFCKVSGLVTEADWQRWNLKDLRPYFDVVVEQFGINRLVFGSDWPVVTLAAPYNTWLRTLLALCADWTNDERDQLFRKNAEHFYRLTP